jgi:O-antigen biosynthesis protein
MNLASGSLEPAPVKSEGVALATGHEAELRKYGMPELNLPAVQAFQLPFEGRRLNLVIPVISKQLSFGGPQTALRLFRKLLGRFEFARIIVTHETDSAFETQAWPDWSVASEDFAKKSIVFLGEKSHSLPVAENDYFIATFWNTAILVQSVISSQAKLFQMVPRRYVYFIQEYDPCFYPASVEYLLAESTYRDHDGVIVVFNSRPLADYFARRSFKFSSSYVHEPTLNVALERRLHALQGQSKDRLIFVYARPFVPRNGFGLLVEGLKTWAMTYSSATQWSVISAGGEHPDLHLPKGVTIRSHGKLTLEEYGEILSRTWVGISLIFAAHPGQVSQEIAEFGAWSITNVTETRRPSELAPNVIGLDEVSPHCIAATLASCCSKYQPGRASVINSASSIFRQGGEEFEFVDDLTREWK